MRTPVFRHAPFAACAKVPQEKVQPVVLHRHVWRSDCAIAQLGHVKQDWTQPGPSKLRKRMRRRRRRRKRRTFKVIPEKNSPKLL